MTKDEVLMMALEALKANDLLINGTEKAGGLAWCIDGYYSDCFDIDPINEQTERAITAIKEALAQEQEQDGECKYCTDGCPACDARKLPAQRTWVGLTDDDELDWEEGSSLKDLVKAIESKLREKNESREWQDLTDDEMLMIYGQKHEGKKYNLGRMVQQALKEKNNV